MKHPSFSAARQNYVAQVKLVYEQQLSILFRETEPTAATTKDQDSDQNHKTFAENDNSASAFIIIIIKLCTLNKVLFRQSLLNPEKK